MTFCTQMILQNLLKLHRLRKLNDRHYPFIVNSPDYPLTSRPPTNLPVPTKASLARLSVRLATFFKQMMHDFGQTQVRLYCRRRTNSDLCRHGKSSSEILSHLRICLEPDPEHFWQFSSSNRQGLCPEVALLSRRSWIKSSWSETGLAHMLSSPGDSSQINHNHRRRPMTLCIFKKTFGYEDRLFWFWTWHHQILSNELTWYCEAKSR